MQVHQREPRTTLDIDLAVRSREQIPGEALRAAGFALDGVFEHSENWRASDGTPVKYTDDATLAEAIGRADVIALEDMELRVIRAIDLLHEKLRSGNDPGRRRSKRLRDLADAQALVEENPAFESELTSTEREILRRLPQ